MFDFIEDRIFDRTPSYIVTPNLHFARLAQKDPEFRSVLDQADIRLCDSAVLSLLSKIKGNPVPQRLTGSDVTVAIIAEARKKKWRIFLLGSDSQTLSRIYAMFPDIMCGIACPPVHPRVWELDCNEEYLQQIKAARPDILFVGLGARKQEYWTHRFYKESGVPVALCIGASLDFIGKRIMRAPFWISKIGCEWLWRLCMEPRRLTSRYASDALFLLTHLPRELFGTRQQAQPSQKKAI